ncbi:MAG: type IV pilus modification protein PilV [Lautropia sp.]|nr:type IV pilus modification protein PilV [Lautropia sp.]
MLNDNIHSGLRSEQPGTASDVVLSRSRSRAAGFGQRGSGLIEVLVAVIVLSVGMLSMLWAQTRSMGFERTAEFRNIAARIADEYADRMRANVNMQQNVARINSSDAYLHDVTYDPKAEVTRYNGPDCLRGTAYCSHEEIARFDQYELRTLAHNSLPGGDLIVIKDTGSQSINIWVMWQQPDVPGLNDEALSSGALLCPRQANSTQTKAQCLQLGMKL